MLKLLKLHNFKTFLNAEIKLCNRHLILGRNNSGKTNLASALRFLAMTAGTELNEAGASVNGGLTEFSNRFLQSNETTFTCRCELDFDGDRCEYEYSLTIAVSPASRSSRMDSQLRASVVEERLWFDGPNLHDAVLLECDGREATMLHEEQALNGSAPHRAKTLAPDDATMLSKLYELTSNRRAIFFRDYLRNWTYYALSPLAMRIGPGLQQDGLGGGSRLSVDGSNLANAVFVLKNMDERSYRRLIDHVRIVEPTLEAINFVAVPNQRPVPFVDLSDAPRTSWTGLSDGTLRVMALALCIEQSGWSSTPNSPVPSLTVIEEPENGVYPGQLRRILELFDEWAPASQFLFTSHSPYVIDQFDARRNCVTILRKERDRSEIHSPPEPEHFTDDDRFTLSMEYASELLQ